MARDFTKVQKILEFFDRNTVSATELQNEIDVYIRFQVDGKLIRYGKIIEVRYVHGHFQ